LINGQRKWSGTRSALAFCLTKKREHHASFFPSCMNYISVN
jgi:hypothetical protein